MLSRIAGPWRALALQSCLVMFPHAVAAAEPAVVTGVVVDAQTGLPVAGARISAADRVAPAISAADGSFELHVAPGIYRLRVTRTSYVTTDADELVLTAESRARITLAIQRTPSGQSVQTIGSTATRADRALQTSTTIAQTLDAESLVRTGVTRAADALRRLPGVNNGITGDTAALGDDVNLSLRGIGTLETVATLDGHPIGLGFPGGYDFQLSPLVGMRNVVVTYGSGSNLNGADAIGGTVDFQTISPTRDLRVTAAQSYGTWGHLTSRAAATGTSGKIGYAVAGGVDTLDGPLRGTFYQSGVAFDPSATDAALRAQATYPADSRVTSRSGIAKFHYDMSAATRLTFTGVAQSLWEDKTGNGDGDFETTGEALAAGQAALAAKPSIDPCPAGSFTVTNSYNAKLVWGQNRNGTPDGGSACQTPSSYATAIAGWHGAGPAWQADHLDDEAVRLESNAGVNAWRFQSYVDRYTTHQDRLGQLPYAKVPGDLGSDRDRTEVSTGLELSDDIVTGTNVFGAGYRYLNRAFDLTKSGALTGAPIVHDTALFVRDSYRAPGLPLTLVTTVTRAASSVTGTSSIDPRVSVIDRLGARNVLRFSAGATTTQPSADQLGVTFAGTKGFGAGGATRVTCGGLNSIGNAPSSVLRPERGVDKELAFAHSFGGDSQAQVSLYDVSVYQKIYKTLVPIAAVGAGFIDGATLAVDRAAVAAACGTNAAATDALLGVTGTVNVGRLRAKGATLEGRQRLGRNLFADYRWALTSTVLADAPLALLQNDPTQILGGQLPRVPLHTFEGALNGRAGALEARYTIDWVSVNNTKALPAYSVSALRVDAPVARGVATVAIANLFNQNADIRGLMYSGVPLPLSSFAKPGAYGPLGAAATERFGLPYRAVTFDYSFRVR